MNSILIGLGWSRDPFVCFDSCVFTRKQLGWSSLSGRNPLFSTRFRATVLPEVVVWWRHALLIHQFSLLGVNDDAPITWLT